MAYFCGCNTLDCLKCFFTLASQWPHIMPSIVMVLSIPCSVVMFRSSFRIRFDSLFFLTSRASETDSDAGVVTTQKLERLIAAAPNIGFSFQPNSRDPYARSQRNTDDNCK